MWKKLFFLVFISWTTKPIQSATIECSWDATQTICTVQSITPVTQQNEAITINGKPLNFVNNDTTYIGIKDQIMDYIPVGLFSLFQRIQTLQIERCETKYLTTDSIPTCVLGTFGLIGGTFTSIPAGFLQSCKNLAFMYIGENNATTIDADALRGLENLFSFGMTKTKISCIPPGLFQHTLSLNQINLSDNLITTIDSNLFVNMPYIDYIYLTYNLLDYIPMFNITKLATRSLQLDLQMNSLKALPPSFCSLFDARGVDMMRIFISNAPCAANYYRSFTISSLTCQGIAEFQSCYGNWTTTMNEPVTCLPKPSTTTSTTTLPPTTAVVTTPSPTPGSCPSDKICRYFLDQYNRYTCILDGVDSVLTSISGNHLITFADSNVRRVIFTNSFLSRIPPILFQKFTSLEYLTVSNCSMSAINTNTFTACGSLKYFDASSNFITTVDGASFKSCSALEVIDLTGNNFDMISGQLFVNNPTLKAVYINRPPAMVLV